MTKCIYSTCIQARTWDTLSIPRRGLCRAWSLCARLGLLAQHTSFPVRPKHHSSVSAWLIDVSCGNQTSCRHLHQSCCLGSTAALLQHRFLLTAFRAVITGSVGGEICIWKADGDWELVKTMKGHKAAVSCLAAHPSGSLALSVSRDKQMRLWDLTKGSCAYQAPLGCEGDAVGFFPDGDTYFISSSDPASAKGSNISIHNTEVSTAPASISQHTVPAVVLMRVVAHNSVCALMCTECLPTRQPQDNYCSPAHSVFQCTIVHRRCPSLPRITVRAQHSSQNAATRSHTVGRMHAGHHAGRAAPPPQGPLRGGP